MEKLRRKTKFKGVYKSVILLLVFLLVTAEAQRFSRRRPLYPRRRIDGPRIQRRPDIADARDPSLGNRRFSPLRHRAPDRADPRFSSRRERPYDPRLRPGPQNRDIDSTRLSRRRFSHRSRDRPPPMGGQRFSQNGDRRNSERANSVNRPNINVQSSRNRILANRHHTNADMNADIRPAHTFRTDRNRQNGGTSVLNNVGNYNGGRHVFVRPRVHPSDRLIQSDSRSQSVHTSVQRHALPHFKPLSPGLMRVLGIPNQTPVSSAVHPANSGVRSTTEGRIPLRPLQPIKTVQQPIVQSSGKEPIVHQNNVRLHANQHQQTLDLIAPPNVVSVHVNPAHGTLVKPRPPILPNVQSRGQPQNTNIAPTIVVTRLASNGNSVVNKVDPVVANVQTPAVQQNVVHVLRNPDVQAVPAPAPHQNVVNVLRNPSVQAVPAPAPHQNVVHVVRNPSVQAVPASAPQQNVIQVMRNHGLQVAPAPAVPVVAPTASNVVQVLAPQQPIQSQGFSSVSGVQGGAVPLNAVPANAVPVQGVQPQNVHLANTFYNRVPYSWMNFLMMGGEQPDSTDPPDPTQAVPSANPTESANILPPVGPTEFTKTVTDLVSLLVSSTQHAAQSEEEEEIEWEDMPPTSTAARAPPTPHPTEQMETTATQSVIKSIAQRIVSMLLQKENAAAAIPGNQNPAMTVVQPTSASNIVPNAVTANAGPLVVLPGQGQTNTQSLPLPVPTEFLPMATRLSNLHSNPSAAQPASNMEKSVLESMGIEGVMLTPYMSSNDLGGLSVQKIPVEVPKPGNHPKDSTAVVDLLAKLKTMVSQANTPTGDNHIKKVDVPPQVAIGNVNFPDANAKVSTINGVHQALSPSSGVPANDVLSTSGLQSGFIAQQSGGVLVPVNTAKSGSITQQSGVLIPDNTAKSGAITQQSGVLVPDNTAKSGAITQQSGVLMPVNTVNGLSSPTTNNVLKSILSRLGIHAKTNDPPLVSGTNSMPANSQSNLPTVATPTIDQATMNLFTSIKKLLAPTINPVTEVKTDNSNLQSPKESSAPVDIRPVQIFPSPHSKTNESAQNLAIAKLSPYLSSNDLGGIKATRIGSPSQEPGAQGAARNLQNAVTNQAAPAATAAADLLEQIRLLVDVQAPTVQTAATTNNQKPAPTLETKIATPKKEECTPFSPTFRCKGKDLFLTMESIGAWCLGMCLKQGCVDTVCRCGCDMPASTPSPSAKTMTDAQLRMLSVFGISPWEQTTNRPVTTDEPPEADEFEEEEMSTPRPFTTESPQWAEQWKFKGVSPSPRKDFALNPIDQHSSRMKQLGQHVAEINEVAWATELKTRLNKLAASAANANAKGEPNPKADGKSPPSWRGTEWHLPTPQPKKPPSTPESNSAWDAPSPWERRPLRDKWGQRERFTDSGAFTNSGPGGIWNDLSMQMAPNPWASPFGGGFDRRLSRFRWGGGSGSGSSGEEQEAND